MISVPYLWAHTIFVQVNGICLPTVRVIFCREGIQWAGSVVFLNATSDSVANGAHKVVPRLPHSITTVAIVHPNIPPSLSIIATETFGIDFEFIGECSV